MGVLVITHLPKLLAQLRPDMVHVMLDGRIVKSGGPELAGQIEEGGYDTLN
jgi:Fe-S cluster assembly ATP-binding protein